MPVLQKDGGGRFISLFDLAAMEFKSSLGQVSLPQRSSSQLAGQCPAEGLNGFHHPPAIDHRTDVMSSPSEQNPSKSQELSARRSKRVNLAIPIVLSGKDSSGNAFQESTRTIIVSKHGAKIRTVQRLNLGASVSIENRSLGLAANATIVSVGQRQSPEEPIEIGVQLTQAGNVWGIVFPPDDWEGGALPQIDGTQVNVTANPAQGSPSEGTSPAPAGVAVQTPSGPQAPIPAAGTAAPSPNRPGSPKAVATSVPAAPPMPAAAPGSSRDKIDAITAAVLAKLTKQLDEAADARLRAYSEKVVRFTNQFALRVQTNFQDAANRTEDQMVVLIQQKLGGLADRVQASRTVLESLLARFDALDKNSKALVAETDQKIREAGRQALETALQELAVNLRKGVEGTSVTLEAECQELVLDAVSRTVSATLAKAEQQLGLQTKDRLSTASAELKGQQEQMLEAVKEQLNQIAVSTTTNVSAKLGGLAGELLPSLREDTEKSLEESAGRVAAQTTQSLREQTQVLVQDALVSLQQAIQSLQDRMQDESRKVRQSSEQEISETAESFIQTVAQRADLAAGSIQSAAEQGESKIKAAQLETARSLQAGVEDYQRQLAARSGLALEGFQSSWQNLARETQDSAAKLFSQRLQSVAEELAEASAENVRQRIQAEAAATAEISSKESQKRLSALVEEFFTNSSRELQRRLRTEADTQLDAAIQSAPDKFAERINKLTQEAGLTLVKVTGGELQKLARTLLQSSSESLRKEVGQLTGALQTDLSTLQTSLADQARKQLLGMSRSTVESLNQEAEAGMEEFRTRLHKVAQESREASVKDLETSFQETLEKQRAAMAVLLQQQAEQSRELAGLQFKTMSEQIVAQAAESINQHVGKSTRTVTELGEQARAGAEIQVQKIESEVQNSIQQYQRQIEQSSNAALDRFRKDTGILLEEVAFRLQQSARSFQSSTGNEVLAELQKASENLLEVSAAQMRKQTEQTLELITERLKQKEEEVVSDAANVFRSRIAEIFSILQPAPRKTSELSNPEQVRAGG
jgi:hypothetical protein